MERPASSRRRFLALAGAGTSASIAGCSGLLNDEPAQTDGEAADGESRQATLFVEVDQQALQEEQMRISQQLEEGEIDQEEAQQQFQETQDEMIGDAMGEVETAADDNGVAIEDRQEQQGALLVSGPATGLIDILSNDSVGGLVDAATFEELQQMGQGGQQGGQQDGQEGTQNDTEADTPADGQ